MKPEAWFVKELQLIAPGVIPVWFSQYNKYFLAKEFPRSVPGITEYEPNQGKHFVVELVLEDDEGNPIPLDGRLLQTLRIMRYEKLTYKLKEIVERWHKEEKVRKEKAIETMQLSVNEFFKMVYRLSKTKTFVLGG